MFTFSIFNFFRFFKFRTRFLYLVFTFNIFNFFRFFKFRTQFFCYSIFIVSVDFQYVYFYKGHPRWWYRKWPKWPLSTDSDTENSNGIHYLVYFWMQSFLTNGVVNRLSNQEAANDLADLCWSVKNMYDACLKIASRHGVARLKIAYMIFIMTRDKMFT